MKHLRLLSLLLIVPALLFVAGCDEETTEPTPAVNEAEVLAAYLESSGDYLNTTNPAMVTAADVRTLQLSAPTTQYLIDTRASADFTAGHIEGAVNVTTANLLTHVQGINAASYTRIVVICYTGQGAGFGTAALRLMGYANASSLKWGMSAWDSTTHVTRWSANIKNTNATQLVTTSTAKNAAGSFPTLSTGKSTGAEILAVRVNALLTEGFTPASVSTTSLFASLSTYYIVNYWPAADYALGHIPEAVQYTPKVDLKVASYLKTLPTDKPIALYCYSGQTSASAAFILRTLGYDVKSVLYGANTMFYDAMPGTKFVPATEIKKYPVVTGS
jgi:rhodanese-related sulfurtransferase